MLWEWVQGEAEYRLKILQAVRVVSDMPTFLELGCGVL
jgi:hypothetical protein